MDISSSCAFITSIQLNFKLFRLVKYMKTSIPITVKTKKYKTLISPARDRNEPVYNWHAFKHSYSKKLVEELVAEFKLTKNSWVLDPFSGGGTTLLACKELGINSKGLDILPFSVFLSNVKTRSYNLGKLKKSVAYFKRGINEAIANTDTLPDIGIMDLAFSAGVKIELLKLRKQIRLIQDSRIRDFYMLALLSILESVSSVSKAGGFLRVTKKKISVEKVYPMFLDRVTSMISDVEVFNERQSNDDVEVDAEVGDARNFSDGRKYDAIITSPPYPNRHDYTRIYALELIVNFVQNNAELKEIRYDTLRSHVEAKKRFEIGEYVQPKTVSRLIKRIIKEGANNSKVPEMIEGYFEDMFLCLKQMQRSLKKNGQIALVVSNVRFSGVGVPVDTILAEIGVQCGLKPQSVITARYRGNSAQQMDVFRRRPTRESIVIWKNS